MATRSTVFVSLLCAIMCTLILSSLAYSQTHRSKVPKTSSDEEEASPSATQQNRNGEKEKKMELGFRYWMVSPKAKATIVDNGSGAGSGTAVLNFDRSNSPEFRYNWRFTRRNNLKIDYLQMSTDSNSGNLSLNLSSGTVFTLNNINLNSIAQANLDVKQLRIGYSWQGLRIKERIKVGPMIEARGMLFDASYTVRPNTGAVGVSQSDSGTFGTGALTLGMDTSVILHRRVEVASAISGIPIAGLGRVFDADTEAKFSLSQNLQLSTAYRYMRVRVNSGQNLAELNFRGPVFGIGFKF